jgi:ATP-dependent DNA helicase RecG
MTTEELKIQLESLLKLPGETEWLEFKEAKSNYNFDNIGKYFSALSNEANLKNQLYGWLVFGINKRHQIVGTNYRRDKNSLNQLKHEIANHTNNHITFIEIHELIYPDGRVVFFQIPPAQRGNPTSWNGHNYGRDGESLVALNQQEYDQIRNQSNITDWSAEICEDATIDDLDQDAIFKARYEYQIKNPRLKSDINSWDDATFLRKVKVTRAGEITRAALILLGKPNSTIFLSPSVIKISWILKDDNNVEIDYKHFDPPLILNTDNALNKIRNLKYRYLPDNTLFPVEIAKYETYVIREALHNCIAHQDYTFNSRITLVEYPEELIFKNGGSFLPGTVENVIKQDSPPLFYRNQFLADAMVNFNMIDTVGGGIKKMFTLQKQRSFPLPSYDLSNTNEVTVKIIGKVLNENYTRILVKNIDLDLSTVILLDKVQKKIKISKVEAQSLKKQGIIDGRFPNVFVSSFIAAITNDKSGYIKYKAFDKQYYKDLVINFIKKYKATNRQEINKLLFNKLSESLSEKQKYSKIKNLLFEMAHKDKSIENAGSNRSPKWILKSRNN